MQFSHLVRGLQSMLGGVSPLKFYHTYTLKSCSLIFQGRITAGELLSEESSARSFLKEERLETHLIIPQSKKIRKKYVFSRKNTLDKRIHDPNHKKETKKTPPKRGGGSTHPYVNTNPFNKQNPKNALPQSDSAQKRAHKQRNPTQLHRGEGGSYIRT